MNLSSRLYRAIMLVVISWHIIGSLLWKAPIVEPYKELRQFQYDQYLTNMRLLFWSACFGNWQNFDWSSRSRNLVQESEIYAIPELTFYYIQKSNQDFGFQLDIQFDALPVFILQVPKQLWDEFGIPIYNSYSVSNVQFFRWNNKMKAACEYNYPGPIPCKQRK